MENNYIIEITESKSAYIVVLRDEDDDSMGCTIPKTFVQQYAFNNKIPMDKCQELAAFFAIERFENRKENKEKRELKKWLDKIGQIEIKDVKLRDAHGGHIYRHMEGSRLIERVIHYN